MQNPMSHPHATTPKPLALSPSLPPNVLPLLPIYYLLLKHGRIESSIKTCLASKDLPSWKGLFIQIDMKSNYITLP